MARHLKPRVKRRRQPTALAKADEGELLCLLRPAALAEGIQVDEAQGVVRGAAILTTGIARPINGDPFIVDETSLRQAADLINARAEGVKCRITHPELEGMGMFDYPPDDILFRVGRVKNARVEGSTLRGDVHLGDYASKSPQGDMRGYLLALVQREAAEIGLSMRFRMAKLEPAPPGQSEPVGRFKEIASVDFVGEPGGNPNGLLSRGARSGDPPAPAGHPRESEDPMRPELLAYLKSIGLKADATPEEAEAFLTGLKGDQKTKAEALRAAAPSPPAPPPTPAPSATPPAPAPPSPPPAPAPAAALSGADEEAIALRERNRITAIRSLAERFALGAPWADEQVSKGTSFEAARMLALEKYAETHQPVRVQVGEDLNRTSLAPAIVDAVLLRTNQPLAEFDVSGRPALEGAKVKRRQPHERSRTFRGLRLHEMARAYLAAIGVPVEGLSATQVASLAFDRRIALAHATSDFPSILADAGTKVLLVAYAETPIKWPQFARARTAPDLKNINLVRRGEIPNLPAVAEGADYLEVTFGESKETYKLAKRGLIFSITLESIINDDTGAFIDINQGMGQAARRSEDVVAFGVITSNPTVGDGKAFFHTDHGNLAGTGAVPSVATLNAMEAAMGVQKGLTADAYLEIEPALLVHPKALTGTVTTLLTSAFDPADNKGHTTNRWQNRLQRCSHGLLDASSATAWYAFADPAILAAIEVCHLEGEEQPVVVEEEAFKSDKRSWKVRHWVAAKAVEWRAAYKNPGA